MVAHALACGIEQGDVVDIGRRIVERVASRIAPRPAAAIAQPEDAGLDVWRIVDGAGDGLELAAEDDLTLDLALVADGTGIEAARHLGVGDDAAALHGRLEIGMAG